MHLDDVNAADKPANSSHLDSFSLDTWLMHSNELPACRKMEMCGKDDDDDDDVD